VTFSAEAKATGGLLAELARLATSGTLRVTVAGTFPLAEAGAAQARIADGHTRGKLLLHP